MIQGTRYISQEEMLQDFIPRFWGEVAHKWHMSIINEPTWYTLRGPNESWDLENISGGNLFKHFFLS